MITRTFKIIASFSSSMDSKVPLSIFKKGKDTLGMKVSAKPGSKQYMVIKIDDESVGLAVKAPPRDGAAN